MLVAVLPLTGCGGSGGPPPAEPIPDTSISATSAPPPVDVTVAFAGDVHFAGRTLPLLAEPATAFGAIAPILAAADLAVINLETAVTSRGTPEPKTFHFRAPASTFTAITAAGVDVVSLANNHALDYGQVGLADTLAAAEAAGVPALGAGKAARAYQPWVVELGDQKLAIVALNHVAELWQRWSATSKRPGLAMARDIDRTLAAVRRAEQQADVVAVYLHWGAEGDACPTAEMRSLAQKLADAGADLIVGAHAHLLQGAGWLDDTYVAYGLGNFLWWRNDAHSNDTAVLQVTLRGGAVAAAELLPAVIDRRTGQPAPASRADAKRIKAAQPGLRRCAGLAASRSDRVG